MAVTRLWERVMQLPLSGASGVDGALDSVACFSQAEVQEGGNAEVTGIVGKVGSHASSSEH